MVIRVVTFGLDKGNPNVDIWSKVFLITSFPIRCEYNDYGGIENVDAGWEDRTELNKILHDISEEYKIKYDEYHDDSEEE